MKTIKYAGSIKQLANAIVEQLEDFYTRNPMDRTIGLTEYGECDYEYDVHGGNVVIPLYTTEGGWSLGDWDGDYESIESWTEEAKSGLSEYFKDTLPDVIAQNDDYIVEFSD